MTNYDPIASTHAFTHQHGGDDPLPMTIWDFYEIGDIHITTTMPDPIPQGWELIGVNRVLIGAGDTYQPEDTGGAATKAAVSHVYAGAGSTSLPHSGAAVADHVAHQHSIGSSETEVQAGSGESVIAAVDPNTGSGGPTAHTVTQPNTHTVPAPDDHPSFSLLPPYFAVYFFRRVS